MRCCVVKVFYGIGFVLIVLFGEVVGGKREECVWEVCFWND